MIEHLTGLVHVGWIAIGDVVWWYVMNDDRPRTNNGTVTNSHSRSYDAAITDIDVLADVDIFSDFKTVAHFQCFCISWCFQSRDGNTRANPGVSSNGCSG